MNQNSIFFHTSFLYLIRTAVLTMVTKLLKMKVRQHASHKSMYVSTDGAGISVLILLVKVVRFNIGNNTKAVLTPGTSEGIRTAKYAIQT